MTMFGKLSERLIDVTRNLSGKGRLTDENIGDSLRQVRIALLEADVALPVVKQFIDDVRQKAVGEKISRSLSPGQMLVRLIHRELVSVMGTSEAGLGLNCAPPAGIMMAGLQGAGKTTTAAKLARWLIEKNKKKVMLVSADIHRPAAILQLERLAADVNADFFPASAAQDVCEIVKGAIAHARVSQCDVLILDTAGRLHVDAEMMGEIRKLHAAANPAETIFVVDAMAGQDAVNAARAFSESLPLTGIVLSKADGDARGGAALSARIVTGVPIKFIGTGEKSDGLEVFHPERIASRILGMGDVLSLVEDVEQNIDREKSQRLSKKIRQGQSFDLEDLREQLGQMSQMGGIGALLDRLPGGAGLPASAQADHRALRRQIAMIDSMTPSERRYPKTINGSRKRRIAAGSGTRVQEVNRLLKQHLQMQTMMKRIKKGGMRRLLQGLSGGGGQMRPRRH